MLLVYEFEVKARLGDPDTERVLDRAMCLPQAEPKLFEAIAGNSIFISAQQQMLIVISRHIETLWFIYIVLFLFKYINTVCDVE